MENALALDGAIHHGATTGADPIGTAAPLKAQLLAEVHQRCIANCLRGLAAPLSALWELACGLGGHGENTRWLRRALEELLGDEGAASVETTEDGRWPTSRGLRPWWRPTGRCCAR